VGTKALLKAIGTFILIVTSTGSDAQTVDFGYLPLARWIIEGEAFDDGLRSIGMPERNVLGEELATCSTDPRTGFTRNGCCGTHPNDRGRHELCAVMTDEFLSFSKEQGNDLVTPRPELEFPGLPPAIAGVSVSDGGSRRLKLREPNASRRRPSHPLFSKRPTRQCWIPWILRRSKATPTTRERPTDMRSCDYTRQSVL
jgi:hypothetical protein